MKKLLRLLLLLPVMAAMCLVVYAGIRYYELYHPLTYAAGYYWEKFEELENPYCGFYEMYGYALSEDGNESVADWSESILSKTDSPLILLQINLRNYSDQDLTPAALAQLDFLLDTFCADNRCLILRFLYDWDNQAAETEPKERKQIITHMGQVADSVNRHKDSILILQGLFTGDCGEMHGGLYGEPEDLLVLATALSDLIDEDIYLAVRTPSQLRSITDSMDVLAEKEPHNGTLVSRLGLFNDGMLGSDTDLGTYDDTPWTEESAPIDKGTRDDEILFQNVLCRHVPNGGEVVIDNPYNDIENAVYDLRDMHVSYLNSGHDLAVIEKWKSTPYNGDFFWTDISGYDYIAAHLGYRYLVNGSSMEFDMFHDTAATLTIAMRNTGFAPAYRRFDSTLTIICEESGQHFQIPLDWDNRCLSNDSMETITCSIPVREYGAGTYNIYLSMTDPSTDLPIRFANEWAKVVEDDTQDPQEDTEYIEPEEYKFPEGILVPVGNYVLE